MKVPRKTARRAIIVTGTPGTGKTTFAKKLAKEIGADYVALTQFVSERKLYTGFDRERESESCQLSSCTRKPEPSLIADKAPDNRRYAHT